MEVARWFKPAVLAHLTPRRINYAVEAVLMDTIRDHVQDPAIHFWSVMSPQRPHSSDLTVFREADGMRRYRKIADQVGVELGEDFHVRDSNSTDDYRIG